MDFNQIKTDKNTQIKATKKTLFGWKNKTIGKKNSFDWKYVGILDWNEVCYQRKQKINKVYIDIK